MIGRPRVAAFALDSPSVRYIASFGPLPRMTLKVEAGALYDNHTLTAHACGPANQPAWGFGQASVLRRGVVTNQSTGVRARAKMGTPVLPRSSPSVVAVY